MISSFAWAGLDCTKDQAKESVLKFCPSVEKDGEKAFSEVSTYRYCGENYIWIQTLREKDSDDIIMKVHGLKPRLIGTNVKDDQSQSTGQFLYAEFDKKVRTSKNGEAWMEYTWVKPGEKNKLTKTSFMKKCGKFLLGSGIWK
jgi:methyl-accepting chemotaxis protein